MWKRKKKENRADKLKGIIEENQRRIEELELFSAMGKRFRYLDLTIVTTGHKTCESYYIHDLMVMPMLTVKPLLKGQYLSAGGEIKDISFEYEQLPVLKAEN